MANEFDTVSERDLGGLGAGRRIAAVRAVDDVGQSINATPEQIAALTGMDYSKLIEQEMPGRYWLGANGLPRQVFTRTVVISSPKSEEIHAGIAGVEKIINISGGATLGGLYKTINNVAELFVRYGAFNGSVRIINLWDSQAEFIISLEYIKI